MPLCPQITNTPITVTQTADFTVTSVIPAVASTSDGLAADFAAVDTNINTKAQTYYALTPPTMPPNNLNVGDLWFDTDDGNKQYRWDGTNWVSVQDGSIATKNRTFYSATAPTATAVGDIWFDTTTGNKPYRWDGSTWISVQDASIQTALNTANAAQTTANGKNKVIYSLSAASGSGTTVGDIWWQYNGSGQIIAQWEWTGSSWSSKTIGSAVIANLDAGKITAGTISVAISLEAATITGGSININNGTFVVTSSGNVTITAGSFNINSGTFQVSNTGAITATSGTVGGWTLDTGGYLRNAGLSTFLYPSTGPGGNANTYAIYSDRGFLGSVLQVQSSSTTALYAPFGGLNVGLGITAANNNFVVSSAGAITSVGNITSSGTVSGSTISGTNVSASSALSSSGTLSVTSTATFSGASNSFPNITQSTAAANLRWGTTTSGRIFESTASSARFKTDIVDLVDVEELNPKKLLDLPVHAFRYKDDYLGEEDERSGALVPGFIAEEVDQFYPIAADYELGQPNNWNDKFMIPAMLSLIQDLYKEIALLKGEQMETELDLATVLQAMREQIGSMAQENAILKATIKKLENGPSCRNCSDTKND